MHDAVVTQLRKAVEEQTRLAAAADHDWRRAELAINQARTLLAADQAHRRADAALVAVEDAESKLARLQQQLSAATCSGRRACAPASTARESAVQDVLFDVG